MSEKPSAINVFQSRRFEKSLSKLHDAALAIVEDQIDLIIENPTIGEQKRGDLAYLRVHKFRLNKQLALLGYSWQEQELEIYLLHLGSHENFYDQMKNQRTNDLKIMEP